MLARGEETLADIVEYLSGEPARPDRIRTTLEATSFEKHTGRKPGEEDVGVAVARKGVAGDWQNLFSREAAEVFDRWAGDILIETGYETSREWMDRLVVEGHE